MFIASIFRSKTQHKLYASIALAWVFFVGVTMWFSVLNDIKQAKIAFQADGTQLEHHILERVKIFGTISDGFTAIVSVMDKPDFLNIRRYVQQIRNTYPDIFMFEFAETVEQKNLDGFLENARINISPDFNISRFNFETDRQWGKPESKESYTPIIFIEPLPTESKKLLGLDIDSHKMFRNVILQANKSNHAVISEPFNLIEGPLAYLVVKSTQTMPARYTIMVILAESLMLVGDDKVSGLRTSLHHEKYKLNDGKGRLFDSVGMPISSIETLLFPEFEDRRRLDSNTHTLILHRYKQIGWNEINWVLIVIISLVGITSFLVAALFAQRYHANRLRIEATTEKLFHLANHDSLTGLANRYLLDDRLKHALEQAKRKEYSIVVLFLDLDGFKAVNDQFGHHAGDEMLKRVSERLRACIREGDTLARRSGDEFIIILENISEDSRVLSLFLDKIHAAFDRHFTIDSNEIKVGASIGTAFYPEDATTAKGLLDVADKAMYEKKS